MSTESPCIRHYLPPTSVLYLQRKSDRRNRSINIAGEEVGGSRWRKCSHLSTYCTAVLASYPFGADDVVLVHNKLKQHFFHQRNLDDKQKNLDGVFLLGKLCLATTQVWKTTITKVKLIPQFYWLFQPTGYVDQWPHDQNQMDIIPHHPSPFLLQRLLHGFPDA